MAILGPLRELDEVAYLRFASVYKAFESAEAFEEEIAMLRAERSVEEAASEPSDVPDAVSSDNGADAADESPAKASAGPGVPLQPAKSG